MLDGYLAVGPVYVIHGGAGIKNREGEVVAGADLMAGRWAEHRGAGCQPF